MIAGGRSAGENVSVVDAKYASDESWRGGPRSGVLKVSTSTLVAAKLRRSRDPSQWR